MRRYLQNAPVLGLHVPNKGALIQVSGISNQGAHILDYKGTDLHDHGEVTAPDSIDQCDQPHLEAAVAAAEVDLEADEVDLEAEGKFKKDPGKTANAFTRGHSETE